jgi:hypothetical protein
MTRRPKGQIPYESDHPNLPGMPDVPGHQQRTGIVVNKDVKRELDRQVERLRKEVVESNSGSENKA